MAGTHFSGRTLSRSLALQLLFQAEATGRLVSDVLEDEYTVDQHLLKAYERELVSRGFEPQEIGARQAEVDAYARQLALGADAMRHELDAVIGVTSSNWSVSRMPAVDRNLLRLALFEILEMDAVDTAVAIDECVDLAKAYGTDESSRFVNGLLGKVARRLEAGEDVVGDALEQMASLEPDAEDADDEELESAESEGDAPADDVLEDLPEWVRG